jgi:hypothetical protein
VINGLTGRADMSRRFANLGLWITSLVARYGLRSVLGRMGEPTVATREDNEIERIELWAEIGKSRSIVEQYEEGQAFFRARIEDRLYRIGRLDERLGDAG